MIELFKKIFKLNKNKKTIVVERSNEFDNTIIRQPVVTFESDEITAISEASFIDASDPLNIAKYKNNLRLLEEEVLASKDMYNFMIIRNDDFLPDDWIWKVASSDTNVEFSAFTFTYNMRMELANNLMGKNNDFLFDIPSQDEERKRQEVLKDVDKEFAAVYRPVHFRSTKHFTVNTPLEYTGSYNNVSSDRKFYVIDYIENFAKSGYGYSADYQDAYLDVTHEGLEISPKAVIFIAEDEYEKIMSDEKLKEQLTQRRVIVYRGSASIAINMFLTENKVLPYNPGQYYEYKKETISILDDSMKRFCSNHNLLYKQGHGNLFGKGGHFSDNLDGEKHDHLSLDESFLNFLKLQFPTYNFSDSFLKNNEEMRNFIRNFGVDRILPVIDLYNKITYKNAQTKLEEYKADRAKITPEISHVFKTALEAIKKYFYSEESNLLSVEEKNELYQLIKLFFHSNKVDEQLLAATTICQKLNVSINDISNEVNNIYS